LELGAVKAMLALALPAVAAPMVGAPGTVTAPMAPSVRPANANKPNIDKTCLKSDVRFLIAVFQNRAEI
jgi:hypothetical protein